MKHNFFKQLNSKIMDFSALNHRSKVAKLAQKVTNRQGNPMYAIDVSRWGIFPPFSDPENATIYRKSIYMLAKDTFISQE